VFWCWLVFVLGRGGRGGCNAGAGVHYYTAYMPRPILLKSTTSLLRIHWPSHCSAKNICGACWKGERIESEAFARNREHFKFRMMGLRVLSVSWPSL
jgi:hypothetical protein